MGAVRHTAPMDTTHTQSPSVDVAPAAMRETEAAHYCGLSAAFFRAARVGRCEGPPYIRVGRAVVYLRTDLDRWLESRRVGGRR